MAAIINISKHITYREATYSKLGASLLIKNDPSPAIVGTMILTAERVFEPVRNFYGLPLEITSFYRCPELNKAVGGAKGSQHIKGEAIDIKGLQSVKNSYIFKYIYRNLAFDQLIWEFGDDKEPFLGSCKLFSQEKPAARL